MKKYIGIALVFVVVLLITAMIIRGSNDSDEMYDEFVQQVEQTIRLHRAIPSDNSVPDWKSPAMILW